MSDKAKIIEEIRRTAAENGGTPLGRLRFEAATAIRPHEWMRFWPSFGEAVREAGLTANVKQSAISDDEIVRHLVALTRELGRFPTSGDRRVKAASSPDFPGKGVFERLGKAELVQRVVTYCDANPGHEDVRSLCPIIATSSRDDAESANDRCDGSVYLIRSGKFFKIGRTRHLGRREYELAIQLPEATQTVHSIATDDPEGIENYWHRRFSDKRRNGEWFELTKEDVRAFQRRKFM